MLRPQQLTEHPSEQEIEIPEEFEAGPGSLLAGFSHAAQLVDEDEEEETAIGMQRNVDRAVFASILLKHIH